MDFFERQDKARRNTKWLVVYFLMAVVCIIASVYLACLLSVLLVAKRPGRLARDTVPGWATSRNPSRMGRWKGRPHFLSGVLSGRVPLADVFPGTPCRANFQGRSATMRTNRGLTFAAM